MLEKLTSSDFAPHLHTAFRLRNNASQQSVAAELYEVELHDPHKGATKTDKRSFSLHFRTDKGTNLPQGIYTVEHDKLGKVDLFLVPVGMRTEYARYEAAFNFAPGEADRGKKAATSSTKKKATAKKVTKKKTATKQAAAKKKIAKKKATAKKKTAKKSAAKKKAAKKTTTKKKAAKKKTAKKKTVKKKRQQKKQPPKRRP